MPFPYFCHTPINCSDIQAWAGRNRASDASGLAAARHTDASQQLRKLWASSRLVIPVISKRTGFWEDPQCVHAKRHHSSSSPSWAGCRHICPAAICTFQIVWPSAVQLFWLCSLGLYLVWAAFCFADQVGGFNIVFLGIWGFLLTQPPPLSLSYFSMISPSGSGWSVWDPGSAPGCSISSACNIDCLVYSIIGLLGSQKTFYKTDLSSLSTFKTREMNTKLIAGKTLGIS